jgi:hypothetical protein
MSGDGFFAMLFSGFCLLSLLSGQLLNISLSFLIFPVVILSIVVDVAFVIFAIFSRRLILMDFCYLLYITRNG